MERRVEKNSFLFNIRKEIRMVVRADALSLQNSQSCDASSVVRRANLHQMAMPGRWIGGGSKEGRAPPVMVGGGGGWVE